MATRSHKVTVIRQSLPESGSPLRIVADDGDDQWAMALWREGSVVHVRTPAVHRTVSADVVTVDFRNGTIGGEYVDAAFARGLEAGYDVRVENASDVYGQFHLVARNGSVKSGSSLRTNETWYNAAFTLAQSTEYAYAGTVVNVYPPIEGADHDSVEVNQPPMADIRYSPDDPQVGETIQLRAAAQDLDGTIAAYEWQVDGRAIGGGETTTISPDSPGTVRVTLTVTDDDGATATAREFIQVDPAPDSGDGDGGLQVSIQATNSPVQVGERLAVVATVENTGDDGVAQPVTLSVGGTQRDRTDVALGPGTSTTVTFEWRTSAGDVGDYTAEVASEDDADTTDVSVVVSGGGGGPPGGDPPGGGSSGVAVTITGTNTPVVEGETVTVTADVENTGDSADTQTVDLSVAGEVVDSTTVSLDSGATESVTFEWATEAGDAGTYPAEVASEDDADQTSVTVTEPGGGSGAQFAVTIDATNSPVEEGDPLEVTATIENTGDAADEQPVRLLISGTEKATATVSLGPGERTTRTFTWQTEAGDAGTHLALVYSEDEGDSEYVTVEGVCERAVSASITGVSPDSPTVGEKVTISAEAAGCGVTTAWDSEGSPEVIDEGDESVTLKWGDTGQYDVTYTVTDEDGEQATETVTVGITTESEILPNFHVDGDAEVAVIVSEQDGSRSYIPGTGTFEVDSDSELWQHQNDNYERFDLEVVEFSGGREITLYQEEDVGTTVSIDWASVLDRGTRTVRVFIRGVGEDGRTKARSTSVNVCRAFDLADCQGTSDAPEYPPPGMDLSCEDETVEAGEGTRCEASYENKWAWSLRGGSGAYSWSKDEEIGDLEPFGVRDNSVDNPWAKYIIGQSEGGQSQQVVTVKASASYDFREGNFDIEDPGTKEYSTTEDVWVRGSGTNGGGNGNDGDGNNGGNGDGDSGGNDDNGNDCGEDCGVIN